MRKARPWLGLILGMLLGLMIAVLIQQEGIWPLDQLMVFGLAGLFGLFGSWLGRVGRDAVGQFSMLTPLVLAVVLLVVGAFGAGAAGDSGELNGPCMVTAQSSVPDSTDVTDTSSGDPFQIDPDGSLSWQAVSVEPITDHNWTIFVDFAGFRIPVASGTDPNTGKSVGNSDTIEDLTGYIDEVTNASGQEIRGVFEVGGYIAQGTTKICDGFGFVVLTTDSLFESLVSKVALGIALLLLLLLLIIFFRRHGGAEVEFGGGPGDGDLSQLSQAGAAGAGGAAIAGTVSDGDPTEPADPTVGPADERGDDPGDEDGVE